MSDRLIVRITRNRLLLKMPYRFIRGCQRLHVAVPVCCVAGFSPWIFNGAGHEWHLRLPRRRSFTSRHHRIGSCTSNSINLEQVPGNIFIKDDTMTAPAVHIRKGGIR